MRKEKYKDSKLIEVVEVEEDIDARTRTTRRLTPEGALIGFPQVTALSDTDIHDIKVQQAQERVADKAKKVDPDDLAVALGLREP